MSADHLLVATSSYFRDARAVADNAAVADGATFYLACIAEQAPTHRLRQAAARHLAIVAARRHGGIAA